MKLEKLFTRLNATLSKAMRFYNLKNKTSIKTFIEEAIAEKLDKIDCNRCAGTMFDLGDCWECHHCGAVEGKK